MRSGGDKSDSRLDNFSPYFQNFRSPSDCLALKSSSQTQYLGNSDSQTTDSVELCNK